MDNETNMQFIQTRNKARHTFQGVLFGLVLLFIFKFINILQYGMDIPISNTFLGVIGGNGVSILWVGLLLSSIGFTLKAGWGLSLWGSSLFKEGTNNYFGRDAKGAYLLLMALVLVCTLTTFVIYAPYWSASWAVVYLGACALMCITSVYLMMMMERLFGSDEIKGSGLGQQPTKVLSEPTSRL
jgi:hypothetical protein